MARFTDLAPEIHEEIARELPVKDLKSLRSTCHTVNNAVTRVFVRQLNYLPHGRDPPPSIRFSAALDRFTRVKDGRVLSRSLAVYLETQAGKIIHAKPNAAYVFKLCMGAVCPARCPHNTSCGLNYRLFQKFTSLRDLTIDMDLFKGDLLRLRRPAQLEALRFYSNTTAQRPTLVQSICKLRHPNLRLLHLTNLTFFWLLWQLDIEAQDTDPATPTDQNPLRLPRLESLALVNIDTNASVLGVLLRRWSNVRRLLLTVNLNAQAHDRIIHDWMHQDDPITPATLNKDLQHLKDTLTELYLTCIPESQSVQSPMRFHGHLVRLQEFPHLQRLSIDPALLIGMQVCTRAAPDPPATTIQFLPSDLAMRLPDGLEYLCLSVNQEQSERLKYYKSGLVAGICDARRNHNMLLSLREVVVIEDPMYASDRRCADTEEGQTHNCYTVEAVDRREDYLRLLRLRSQRDSPLLWGASQNMYFGRKARPVLPYPEGF